jgi:hypothetical protein
VLNQLKADFDIGQLPGARPKWCALSPEPDDHPTLPQLGRLDLWPRHPSPAQLDPFRPKRERAKGDRLPVPQRGGELGEQPGVGAALDEGSELRQTHQGVSELDPLAAIQIK